MATIADDASSMSDDVFEDPEVTARRIEEQYSQEPDDNKLTTEVEETHRTPSPSGYPGYHPPREALQLYGLKADTDMVLDTITRRNAGGRGIVNQTIEDDDLDDGWKSYRYEEEDEGPAFDDTINHKTILLGDSGVGKTSFLVKYNTGEFKAGSFSATVGIALNIVKIFFALLAVALAEVPTNSPYGPSGWRPQGASFDLPNEYYAAQAQRVPPVELEITKERVDYAGRLNENNKITLQLDPYSAYLRPNNVDESNVDIVRIQNRPSSGQLRAPQLNYREYYPQQQVQKFRKIQSFSGNSNRLVFSRQEISPASFPSNNYGPPAPEQPSTQYGAPENPAIDLDLSALEDGEKDKIVAGSITKGEYFVLTPEKTLQKVSYKTSQTEKEAQTNAFTAELKYTPVEQIDGPLYKYNAQGQLVRIYKK